MFFFTKTYTVPTLGNVTKLVPQHESRKKTFSLHTHYSKSLQNPKSLDQAKYHSVTKSPLFISQEKDERRIRKSNKYMVFLHHSKGAMVQELIMDSNNNRYLLVKPIKCSGNARSRPLFNLHVNLPRVGQLKAALQDFYQMCIDNQCNQNLIYGSESTLIFKVIHELNCSQFALKMARLIKAAYFC